MVINMFSLLVNPLQPVFEWFMTLYSLLPLAVRQFINLVLGLVVVTAIFSLFFRSRH